MVRKIAVITGSRGEWGYIRPILKLIDADPELDYQLIVTNMHLLPEFGYSVQEIEKDGFIIKGSNILYNTSINAFKDHRIAMTFEILSLILGEELNTDTEQSIISTSFPEFYTIIREIHE